MFLFYYFQRQSSVYLLLPSPGQEGPLTACIIAGFVLKLIQLVLLIAGQVNVDIFFIDWERPKGKSQDSKSKSFI